MAPYCLHWNRKMYMGLSRCCRNHINEVWWRSVDWLRRTLKSYSNCSSLQCIFFYGQPLNVCQRCPYTHRDCSRFRGGTQNVQVLDPLASRERGFIWHTLKATKKYDCIRISVLYTYLLQLSSSELLKQSRRVSCVWISSLHKTLPSQTGYCKHACVQFHLLV